MPSETRKKSHTGRIILLCLLAALLIFGVIFSHFGGLGPGKCADKEAFSSHAREVTEIILPEHTRIAALGEATHGNKEFQQLKRTVFQIGGMISGWSTDVWEESSAESFPMCLSLQQPQQLTTGS